MMRLNDDIRPLSHRLCDETRSALEEYTRSACPQAAVSGSLSRDAYAEWLTALRPLHAALDRQIIAHTEDVPLLSTTVPDDALQCPWLDESLAAMGKSATPARSPEAEAAVELVNNAAEHEPIKLFAHHFVREGLINVGGYLAPRVRDAWGDAKPGELRFLDPYGRGQRPLWARFCRDVDKHRMTEHEKQALATAAVEMLQALTAISNASGDLAEAPKLLPVSL